MKTDAKAKSSRATGKTKCRVIEESEDEDEDEELAKPTKGRPKCVSRRK